MHRAILYDTVNSQIFNDQFEIPGLNFLLDTPLETIYQATDKAFNLLATSLANDETDINVILSAMSEGVLVYCTVAEDEKAATAAKFGCFLLSCFSLVGLVEIQVDKGIGKLLDWDEVKIRQLLSEREKLTAIKPTLTPAKMNISRLIKRARVILNPDESPIAINTIQKMFNRGWCINTNVLAIALRHFKSDSEVFKTYYKSTNSIARESKKALCCTIIDLAIELQSNVFYHKYFFDFRGRVYCATGFLHEQGNDLAKSLILLAEGKALGPHGEKWLKHAVASTWAGVTRFGLKSDKLSLAQRVQWVDEHIGTFLNYANNPDEFTGWMKADSPWQFLAACIELALLEQWKAKDNNPEDFMSKFVVYIDGTCNGSQHLAALTRDEIAATHVNLKAGLPVGDLYKYISEFVWNNINSMEIEAEDVLEEMVEQVSVLRRALLQADKEELPAIRESVKCLRESSKDTIKAAAPIYWKKVEDPNQRRKLIKRNVMTMVYGVTRYGSGEQIMEDAPKHGIALLDGMDSAWAIWLGGLVYDTMTEAMPASAKLLNVFEVAGKRKGNVNKSLKWKTPIVNFPVVQDYRLGAVVKKSALFHDDTIVVSLRDPSDKRESPSKQKTGAPPNIVHSMDATHLMLTAEYCKEPLVTVHDSFGTLAGGMEWLYEDVRSTFIMLYYNNPLDDLLKQLGIDDLEVERGSFNILEVKDAEYCFI
jgi:hypothetical protein